jgi:hypothetical protein
MPPEIGSKEAVGRGEEDAGAVLEGRPAAPAGAAFAEADLQVRVAEGQPPAVAEVALLLGFVGVVAAADGGSARTDQSSAALREAAAALGRFGTMCV